MIDFSIHSDYWIERSAALDSDFYPPAPEGCEYYNFQRAGIEYARHRDGVWLGDAMGVGKTVQFLGYVNFHTEYINSILIVCQDNAKIHWEKHCKTWLIRDYSVRYMTSSRKWKDADIVILNYELLWKFDDQIKARHWDLAGFDEIHFLKTPTARRTKCVLGGKVGKKRLKPLSAKRRIGMSGTPMENGKPKELIAPLHVLGKFDDIFVDWHKYVHRYCDAHEEKIWTSKIINGRKKAICKTVLNYDGASNLDELNDKLRTHVMVRRLKEDVLPELPDKIREVIEIDASQNLVRQEKKQLPGLWNDLEGLDQLRDDEFDHKLLSIQDNLEIAFSQSSTVRQDTGLAKMPYVVSHIKDLLSGSEEKVICFAWHQEVVKRIHEAFPGSVIHYGGMSAKQKQESVDRFQNDDTCRLLVGNLQSAGTSITLTAGAITVMAEFEWLPGKMLQAEDRTCRIGAKRDSLLYHYIALKDSIDAKMARAFIRKRKRAEQGLDRRAA